MQAKGGTRTPHGGSSLAVPSSSVTRTSRGVPPGCRPKNLPTAVRKGDVLYAKGRKGRLRLLYVLKPTTAIPKRVPFYEDNDPRAGAHHPACGAEGHGHEEAVMTWRKVVYSADCLITPGSGRHRTICAARSLCVSWLSP